MIVQLVAQTQFDAWKLAEVSGYVPHFTIGQPSDEEQYIQSDYLYDDEPTYEMSEKMKTWLQQLPSSVDELAEAAGRGCYESWDRPNPKTATNAGYLANIIRQQHFSVLEHASATFYITGVSRSLLTELERHRHFSYSVVSQRYVDHSDIYDNGKYVIPPIVERLDDASRRKAEAVVAHHANHASVNYAMLTEVLGEATTVDGRKLKKKEIRGAARYVLPEATDTSLFLTGNFRAFREFIGKRDAEGVELEIRLLARELLLWLKEIAPNTFQDITLSEIEAA